MKLNEKVVYLFFLLLLISKNEFSQTVTISPIPTAYNDIDFTTADFDDLKDLSNDFRGKQKISIFTPTSVVLDPTGATWHAGAWGRGYYSSMTINEYYTSADDYSEFFAGNAGKFLSCHPLVRHTSTMTRGHIQTYSYTGENVHLNIAKDGIDYLLETQRPDGGFVNWRYRENQHTGSNNHASNVTHIYATSHALRTLCEFRLIDDYESSSVETAIIEAAEFLMSNVNLGENNYNYSSFSAWGLASAYKVTKDCRYRDKAYEICQYLIDNQDKSGITKGAWASFQVDSAATFEFFHDTKIFYHTIILRGLIETFDITPNTNITFKHDLLETIKLGVNHLIDTRLRYHEVGAGTHTIPNLRYLWTDVDGNVVPANYDWAPMGIGSGNIFEPFAMLLYYSNFHDGFTAAEKTNLRRLLNYLALNLEGHKEELSFFSSMAYYANYLNAYKNNLEILPWGNANIHYDASNIADKIVVGDFDNDGDMDDVAAFYYYGSGETRIHVWSGEEYRFDYKLSQGWWNSMPVHGWYDATKIDGRVVSGDFDNDGEHDDIAAFYAYGTGITKIHVWLSDGTKFIYQGSDTFWNQSGYNAHNITNRVVSGDFDNDGDHDDIAAFYDYGGAQTRIHVWLSNGSEFQYQYSTGWWGYGLTGYDPNKITGRVVSGDFDNDNEYDDIAVFYDYGGEQTRIHVWLSDGGEFHYQYSTGWWGYGITGYDPNKITGRVVSGDFDDDNKHDDIAVLYDYGGHHTRIHIWRSNGGSFLYGSSVGWWGYGIIGYDANKATGRVLSGDFNDDGIDDICGMYYSGNETTNMHVWKSTGSGFNYSGAYGWWHDCVGIGYMSPEKWIDPKVEDTPVVQEENLNEEIGLRAYPNPTAGIFNLNIENYSEFDDYDLTIFTLDSKKILEQKITGANTEVDLSSFMNGVYILQLTNGNISKQLKLIKNN